MSEQMHRYSCVGSHIVCNCQPLPARDQTFARRAVRRKRTVARRRKSSYASGQMITDARRASCDPPYEQLSRATCAFADSEPPLIRAVRVRRDDCHAADAAYQWQVAIGDSAMRRISCNPLYVQSSRETRVAPSPM